MKPKKTWQEKLADSKGCPKVMRIEGNLTRRWGEGTFVIPAPLEVDAIMKRVRKGRLTTIDHIRKELAATHAATIACPITTGIFAWIAAYAAEEAATAGKKRFTPYWRTLKTNGELNPKYPGGIPRLKKLLEAEGHQILQRGQRHFVADFSKSV